MTDHITSTYIMVAALWFFAGATFWIAATLHNGWPRRWRTPAASREYGWADVIVLFPICLAGGPVWWAIWIPRRLYLRLTRKSRAHG